VATPRQCPGTSFIFYANEMPLQVKQIANCLICYGDDHSSTFQMLCEDLCSGSGIFE